MGIAALLALNAFVVILVSLLRDLQTFERISRCQAEELAERQTLDLYRIGHDMKNNATLIQAVCEVPDADNRILETVKSINILGNVLVSDMVDMVNGKQAHRVVPKEDVDVTELLNVYSMVGTGMLLLEGKDKDVTVGVRIAGSEKFEVYTNRERLHQIMCNLLSNAVKYTQTGKIVLVAGCCSENTVEIRVVDSGIGLCEADVCRVFDLFFRSRRASQISSGTGLGLSNVRNICDAIGAKIGVSSPGEGKGCTFTLVLPRRRRSIFSGHGQISMQFSFRVLAMDDSIVILRLLSKYFTSFGCEVVNACSAEESRALLGQPNQEKFDVVITDSFMGDETGIDVIHSLRRGAVRGLPSDLPCILCSGDSHEFDDPRTVSITKPFSSADIADALNIFATSDVREQRV
ncbi:histidine kinase-like protein [Ectocarpus siliculosus]|uniref:Histidine kinase-like protein n=1 Tax=Ectocarpus siliculosus TaxID=2880 RepID=D7G325_ECTSI|nr:histidine kinase-like protein [Ectocarpus siliculosus]|eukprot:CBJ33468.1 histidine kinase-like protein [Ectocarpus siliculosus]